MIDYFERGDSIYAAIEALRSVKSSFVGDTTKARQLILALCDQAGATIEAQRAIAALLYMPEEAMPLVLQGSAATSRKRYYVTPFDNGSTIEWRVTDPSDVCIGDYYRTLDEARVEVDRLNRPNTQTKEI